MMKQSESESRSVASISLQPRKLYTVHGVIQARILEWVAVLFSRGSSQTRDQTQVSHTAGGFFTSWAAREALWWSRGMINSIPGSCYLWGKIPRGCPPTSPFFCVSPLTCHLPSHSSSKLGTHRGILSPPSHLMPVVVDVPFPTCHSIYGSMWKDMFPPWNPAEKRLSPVTPFLEHTGHCLPWSMWLSERGQGMDREPELWAWLRFFSKVAMKGNGRRPQPFSNLHRPNTRTFLKGRMLTGYSKVHLTGVIHSSYLHPISSSLSNQRKWVGMCGY